MVSFFFKAFWYGTTKQPENREGEYGDLGIIYLLFGDVLFSFCMGRVNHWYHERICSQVFCWSGPSRGNMFLFI